MIGRDALKFVRILFEQFEVTNLILARYDKKDEGYIGIRQLTRFTLLPSLKVNSRLDCNLLGSLIIEI